jgi:L-glyceraldehyde 3-phosphate reductase
MSYIADNRRYDSVRYRRCGQANLDRVRGLADLARAREQTLPQMGIAWVLREPRVTSAVVRVSSVEQLEADVAALGNLSFSAAELEAIDRFAVDAGIDLWEESHRF